MVSAELDVRTCGDHVMVTLHGELDVIDAAAVSTVLAAAVAGAPQVVIDLTGLEYIDCCALGVLSRTRSQARRAGGDLLLAAPGALVRRVIAVAAMSADFTVHASAGEAVRAAGWAGAGPPGACAVGAPPGGGLAAS